MHCTLFTPTFNDYEFFIVLVNMIDIFDKEKIDTFNFYMTPIRIKFLFNYDDDNKSNI